ncbi:probable lysophospholipase BODYGUARD 4 [Herrania umbratica]|uniref:Probable lysophospholipase BODYGUARD 4 n=1 Tax=Herrania umbratica TaxID=108875 RepID=A0A6J1A6A9_9ROSI|nr:probable lysophospholipase BODYGUARD 4 [Herrania umbratica]
MSIANLLGKGTRKCGTILLDAITFFVFLFLDLLDAILCVVCRFLDEFFEGEASPCYCVNKGEQNGDCGDGERDLSETLYGRKNVFREMGFLGFRRQWEYRKKSDGFGGGGRLVNRWSDCGCESCVSWMKNDCQKLHVVVKEQPQVESDDSRGESAENVIFLHGFLSSSSLWTDTVFKNLSGPVKGHYRLFAVDLLGFGRSPKPSDSMYALNDHVEMIEKSVISPYQLNSFHLVAHSMGCIVAVALAAKYSKFVKSVTLVAPPYFPSAKDGTSTLMVLETLAGKRLWPPLAFVQSVMSWYEHVGRCFCFLCCRNHRVWERILKLLTQRRELDFMAVDFTRHTHHSAWHSMHNVICGGAKYMHDYLEILYRSRVKVCLIHGDQDAVVPLDRSVNIKMKFPDVELNIIQNADHVTIILGRKKDFTENLERIWASSQM